MKTIIISSVIILFIAGCSSRTIVENQSNGALHQSPNSNVNSSVNKNVNANSNSLLQDVKGEKIEKPLDVNFKDDLPQGWEWIDADKKIPAIYDIRDGWFSVKIPTNRDFYGDNYTAPRLLKAVSGDFEIETRVKFSPTENYQGAGILVFKDNENYLRLERGFGGVGGGDSGIRLDRRNKEGYEAITTQEKFPTEAKQVDLKIVRKGKDFRAFWRENEDGEWKLVGEYSADYPETVRIGLIGVNTATEITAEFAYIKLAPVAK